MQPLTTQGRMKDSRKKTARQAAQSITCLLYFFVYGLSALLGYAAEHFEGDFRNLAGMFLHNSVHGELRLAGGKADF